MNNRVRHLVLLLLLAIAGTVVAQTETPAAQYSEEIDVRVIDVDVVVTDRKGNRLTNLTREDFELYEDGKRVDVAYFSRTVGGRIADMPVPAPVAGSDVVATAQPAVAPRIPLTWIIYIDHTNLPPQSRNRAMRALQEFVRFAMSRGDRGVIALNNGRSFKIRHGVTDDPRLLMETLAKMEKESVPVSPTKSRTNNVLNIMRRREEDFGNISGGINHTMYMAQETGNEIQAIIEEEAGRTKFAVASMRSLLNALADVNGRLALVYVGAGFNTLPAADLAATWRLRYGDLSSEDGLAANSEPRPEDEVERIEREITQLYNNLSALRVTVYSIHGGEPGGGPTSAEDSGTTDTMKASSIDNGQLMEAANSRELAQRTGGLYFKVNPGLAGQLDDVVRDLDDYYSLGYKPAGQPGETRRIKVKVKVDGARVRHRETVRERTPNEKAAGAVVASMVQPPPKVVQKVASAAQPALPAAVADAANPLGVSVQAERPKRHGWDHLLPFNFSINLEALTFAKYDNGLRAEFVMHFALVGQDGSVYPLESREQSLTVPSSEAPKPGSFVSYAWHANMGPLHIPQEIPAGQKGMRLTVTVEDHTSGNRSVVTVPLGKSEATRG